MGSSGPSFGTLGLLGVLFVDLWVTFGVPWAGFGIPLDGFGVPLGSLLEALGPFGGAHGKLLASFGLHLGPLRGEKCDKCEFSLLSLSTFVSINYLPVKRIVRYSNWVSG